MTVTTLEARPPATYDPTLRALHWVMAILFLANVALGFYASTMHPGTGSRPALLEVHKSLGVTLLVLVVLRGVWRMTHSAPAAPALLSQPARVASNLVHGLLYVLMLGMPLSGMIDSLADGHSIRWFGLFQIPAFLPQDKALSRIGETAHALGAYAVYTLVALHIGAALWHAAKRDGILRRMTG
jgi:cytochrome b561